MQETTEETKQRVLGLAAKHLKPHAIARELMGAVPIATIYQILEEAHVPVPGITPCWREAEIVLSALDRDLTADDYVAALRRVTGREPNRLSVLQQMSRRFRLGILTRVGKGTYRVVKDQLKP